MPKPQPALTDEDINQGKPMSAVNGNAQTIIEDCDSNTIVVNKTSSTSARLQINSIRDKRSIANSVIPEVDTDVTRIEADKTLIFSGRPKSSQWTRIAVAQKAENTLFFHSVHSDHTVLAKNSAHPVSDDTLTIVDTLTIIDDKTRLLQPSRSPQIFTDTHSDADWDLLTRINVSHHSNRVGLLAARELFQKALEDKGRILNKRFVLESVLGIGGMGVVYLTRDLRRVEAEDPFPYVATKVLNDDFKNHPDAFVALQQEAVKSQMLSHPNIVTVHDFDRDGNTLFMTMELLRGNPLDKLIKHNYQYGMPMHEAISIFNDLCDGLSCAHKNNLIHSDFKPMNVFVTFRQVAKILDFGIARVCSNNDVKLSKFDAGNLGAITPEYASLEMLKKQEPHYSDDIYALACVFYLTLTGKHPYNRLPANEALKKKMTPERVKCLSNSQWKALEKGLAFERKNRFQSVDEFKKAFHQTQWYMLKRNVTVAALSTLLMTAGLILALI
jgi:hypothetical protein